MAKNYIDVDIKGTNTVKLTLDRVGVRFSDLAPAFQRIGARIANEAMVLAPVLTGRLRRTIRNSKAKSRSTVRAGNNRMPPYAGVIHYGGYNNIQAHPFLTTALHRNADYIHNELNDEIGRVIREFDLNRRR